jgi:hypothetical protein
LRTCLGIAGDQQFFGLQAEAQDALQHQRLLRRKRWRSLTSSFFAASSVTYMPSPRRFSTVIRPRAPGRRETVMGFAGTGGDLPYGGQGIAGLEAPSSIIAMTRSFNWR